MPGDEDGYCALGAVLAAGDVTGDGKDDIAVSDTMYDCHNVETEFGKGVVVLLRGSSSGLTTSGSQALVAELSGRPGRSAPRTCLRRVAGDRPTG